MELAITVTLIWIALGLLWVREVRLQHRGAKIELKFWVTGTIVGPLILAIILALFVARLLATGLTRLLNFKF